MEKARSTLGGRFMRSIYEIQQEIGVVNHKLKLLILEKKLAANALWNKQKLEECNEKIAEILAVDVIEKMKK
jgi:hypothetical protein